VEKISANFVHTTKTFVYVEKVELKSSEIANAGKKMTLTTQERINVVKWWYRNDGSVTLVQQAWRQHYGRNAQAPTYHAIRSLIEKFFRVRIQDIIRAIPTEMLERVSDNLLSRCTACIIANGKHLDVTICDQD